MLRKLAVAAAALAVGVALTASSPSAAFSRPPGGGGPSHFGGGPSMHFTPGGFAAPRFTAGHFAFSHAGFAPRHYFGAPHYWRHSFGGYALHRRFGPLWTRGAPRDHVAPYAAVGHPGGAPMLVDRAHYRQGWADWRRSHRGYGGWAGLVFWPYAYDDLFDYAFWPDDYWADNDLFWAYGYDDLFAGILTPYGYAGLQSGYAPLRATAAPGAPAPAPSSAQLCASAQSLSGGVAIDQIAKAVQPTADQNAKLDALKTAEENAAKTLAASCAEQAPTTALGRLDSARTRLQAMAQAVETVAGPLGDFYSSLTDEQKAAFNALGAQARTAGPANLAELCGPQNAAPLLAADRIEAAVGPDAKQKAALAALSDVAGKADQAILASCPARAAMTPPGRLDAIHQRLQAMLAGVDLVRPALQDFYASLSDAQKAKFDALVLPPAPAAHNAKAP